LAFADARVAVAAMGISVEPLTATIAETAATLRADHDRLRLSDSIVLATAQQLRATLLTYDDQLSRLAHKPSS
jgi:predicted nucleic acid-binding protein